MNVAPSHFVAVVGPSGCGKTTLLNIIAGLVRPAMGEVVLGGRVVEGPDSRIAYMLARDALLPWATALENAELGLRVRGVRRAERKQRAQEWLERVGLHDSSDTAVSALSQGMRQRVAIARTLALSPECILMDEPFAALDAQTRLFVQEEFVQLWEATRATILLVTHDLHEAVLLADRVLLLSRNGSGIVCDMDIPLPRPRDLTEITGSLAFAQLHAELAAALRTEARRPTAR